MLTEIKNGNTCTIAGLLAEKKLRRGTFNRDGASIPYISGDLIVRVKQEINHADGVYDIPVSFFAAETTSKGNADVVYEELDKIMNDSYSIADIGEDGADAIVITACQLQNREYYNERRNEMGSVPEVNGRFIRKVEKAKLKPEANFSLIFTLVGKTEELDSEENPTGRLKIKAAVPNFKGEVDIIELYTSNSDVSTAIDNYWNLGDTVQSIGKVNFTQTTKTIKQEVDFGEPIEKTITRTLKEFLITGGSSSPLDPGYDADEIKAEMNKIPERHEAIKAKALARAQEKKVEKAADNLYNTVNSDTMKDYGF